MSLTFSRPLPRPLAVLRLFCLPYAGGSSATYLPWAQLLDARIELVMIDPPGRSRRLLETPFSRVDDLVDALAPEMLALLDRPYALFGHSNGALVAFELARRLRDLQRPPALFLASAKAAPRRIDETEGWHFLPDAELLAAMRQAGYVSSEFLDEPQLAALFLPVLRADFALGETYLHRPAAPLPCALAMLAGHEDASLDEQDQVAWRDEFAGPASFHPLPGGHLFIEEYPDLTVNVVNRVCAPVLEAVLAGAGTCHERPAS